MDTPKEPDESIEFTEDQLREFALQARKMETRIKGMCYEICHNIGNILIDNGMPYTGDPYTVEHKRVGDNNEEKHFILILDGKYVQGVDETEEVYIDASLDQFCEENKQDGLVDISLGACSDIQEVYIYYPDDSGRQKYNEFKELL